MTILLNTNFNAKTSTQLHATSYYSCYYSSPLSREYPVKGIPAFNLLSQISTNHLLFSATLAHWLRLLLGKPYFTHTKQ